MAFESGINTGNLSSAPDNGIVNHVYAFVSKRLIQWADTKTDRSNWNEDKLTDELCRVLEQTTPAEYPYVFHHQKSEDSARNTSTDMAAFEKTTSVVSALSSAYKTAIVKFEAKRLTNNLATNREKEYVIGQYQGNKRTKNSGAIERFKNETHGKDVSNAAILAYVQRDSFCDWESKINGWIGEQITSSSDTDLTWTESDLPYQKNVNGKLATFNSVSDRKTQNPLPIKHFWIDLTFDTKSKFQTKPKRLNV